MQMSRKNSFRHDSGSSRGGSLASDLTRKESLGLRRKESGLARKVSDAALYGFNKPQDIEEMRPEKEPLVIEDDSIPPGDDAG